MAQVGACVPAESMELTACDAIFVRMGGKDNIMAEQSTFLVELAETAAVLRRATRHSCAPGSPPGPSIPKQTLNAFVSTSEILKPNL